MQSSFKGSAYVNDSADTHAFSKLAADRVGWFPRSPNCLNHKADALYDAAFVESNFKNNASCSDCFMQSTIRQSMTMSCQHLHAYSNCENCYSQRNPPSSLTSSPDTSPPLLSDHSPVVTGCSPPFFPPVSPHPSNHSTKNYSTDASMPVSTQSFNLYCKEVSAFDADQQNSSLMYATDQHSAMEHHVYPPYYPTHNTQFLTASNNVIAASDTQTTPPSASTSSTSQHRSKVVSLSNCKDTDTLVNSVCKPSNRNPTSCTDKKPNIAKQESNNRKRSAEDVCEVCGDRASGYHYNALTCEGCKGFFRRSINRKEPPYKCKFGGACEMDTYTRRKCPECRLRKCKAVGMLEECLLTEIQCQSKRRSRKSKKSLVVEKPNTKKEANSSLQHSCSLTVASTVGNKSQDSPQQTLTPANATEERLVGYVGRAFSEYRANPEIVKRWASYLENSAERPNLSEISTVHVQVVVEFTKNLPGFIRLMPEDQIALLKGSVVEVMLLRNACGYNLKKGELDISAVFKDTGLHETKLHDGVLDFFSCIRRLDLDMKEYGLLCAIILFDSDHPHTQDKTRIDHYRDTYLSALTYYSEKREPRRPQIVAKILNLITELRSLYGTHAQMVWNLKEKEGLSPLLCEIWDLGR